MRLWEFENYPGTMCKWPDEEYRNLLVLTAEKRCDKPEKQQPTEPLCKIVYYNMKDSDSVLEN